MTRPMPILDDCAVRLTSHACGCITNSATGLHAPCATFRAVWQQARYADVGTAEGAAMAAEYAEAERAHLASEGVTR